MSRSEFDSLEKNCLQERGVRFGLRLNSPTSQGFIVGPGRIERREFLKAAFGVENPSRFDEKYEEASTGSGNPCKDFDSLRSSALCALLSFYNIKDLEINGIHYDKAYFEVQNVVITGEKPSNMDVVLVSNDNKTILFLECKFSEYKSNAQQLVPNAYLDKCAMSKQLYELIVNEGLGTIDPGDKKFIFRTKCAYSQGTKQVISHLVGITSFLQRPAGYGDNFSFYGSEDQRRNLYKQTFDRVIFQEVLFELKGYEAELNAYLCLSEKIRKLFNASGIIEGIEFAPATTYQQIFKNQKDNVDGLIASFYKY